MNKEENNVIRVLNIVPNMRAAGIESFIMNVYRHIDHSKIQFDFLVHSEKEQIFDEEIERFGGRIYRLTYKDDKNLLKYIRDLNCFFKLHKEYQIVHGQMQSMMPLYLYLAKKNGVPIRIAHAHNSSYEKSLKGVVLHLFSRFSKYPANYHFACSKMAGNYLFGKTPYEVIYNSIDINRFLYDEDKREKVRKALGLTNEFTLGHIGRFELQKNHTYLIEIFLKVLERCPDAVLLLIGEGRLTKNIQELVNSKQISSQVKFLGLRKDVEDLYQAMDCFVLPSLYEGLPVVGVESQVNGLPSFFSSNITRELDLSNCAHFLSISPEEIDSWANEILEVSNNKRQASETDWSCSYYNIDIMTNDLTQKYQDMLKKVRKK